jgi:hypothetical protein
MAIQVINDPHASRSAGLGAAVGKSLGSMLTNLATRKLQNYEKEHNAQNVGNFLKKLGVPEDAAASISQMNPALQGTLMRGLLSGDEEGTENVQPQQQPQQEQQTPYSEQYLAERASKQQQKKLRSLFSHFRNKGKGTKRTSSEINLIAKSLTSLGLKKDLALQYATLPPNVFSKVLSEYFSQRKQEAKYKL